MSEFSKAVDEGVAAMSEEADKAEKEVKEKIENAGSSEKAPVGKYSFDGTTCVTEKITYKITNTKIIPPHENKDEDSDMPMIVFYFDATVNEGVEPCSPDIEWIKNFEAYQDVDPDEPTSLDTAVYVDPHVETSLETTAPGETVQRCTVYVLADDSLPVRLVARNSIFDDKPLGEHEYPVK